MLRKPHQVTHTHTHTRIHEHTHTHSTQHTGESAAAEPCPSVFPDYFPSRSDFNYTFGFVNELHFTEVLSSVSANADICVWACRCVRNSPPLGNLYWLIKTVFHFVFETIFYSSDPVSLFSCVCSCVCVCVCVRDGGGVCSCEGGDGKRWIVLAHTPPSRSLWLSQLFSHQQKAHLSLVIVNAYMCDNRVCCSVCVGVCVCVCVCVCVLPGGCFWCCKFVI